MACTGPLDPLPQDSGTAGLKEMLLRLQTTARLLQTTAHPDDEDSGMLTLESRGKGVTLQKYHGAALSDLTTFKREEGLIWQMGGGRTRTEPEIPVTARGRTGNLPPRGFPQTHRVP